MAVGYFGFFVKIKTPLSSQEIYELLQISRIMKLKNGAAYAFCSYLQIFLWDSL